MFWLNKYRQLIKFSFLRRRKMGLYKLWKTKIFGISYCSRNKKIWVLKKASCILHKNLCKQFLTWEQLLVGGGGRVAKPSHWQSNVPLLLSCLNKGLYWTQNNLIKQNVASLKKLWFAKVFATVTFDYL